MAIVNREVRGYRLCGICGKRGSVHLARGRRRSLYQRNCDCGCQQGNGAVFQSMLWYETEWLEGLKPEYPPANAMDSETYRSLKNGDTEQLADTKPEAGQVDGQAPVNKEPSPVKEPDFDPVNEPELDQDLDQESSVKSTKTVWWLVAAAGILTAIVAG